MRVATVGQAVGMGLELHPPHFVVEDAVRRSLVEDLSPLGDLTSSLLPDDLVATAELVSRKAGVIAGVDCVIETFRQIDPDVELEWSADDGDQVDPGALLATVTGRLASVLTAERTALNFIGHLSGIATLTRQFVEAARAGGPAGVWDTRKTTPGLRTLEKAAVRAGGASNHRGNLSDWILLKDNHLALMGIAGAIGAARSRWPARTVHVECDRPDQVEEALFAGADALLLDNMTLDEVRTCVAAADAHTASTGGRRPLLEVSGNVSLATIGGYAGAGVDLISIGAITNSAPVLDIGLDIDVPGALEGSLAGDLGEGEAGAVDAEVDELT
jgi:nicotinate-nucleotide pyrophosphorylase (carboxylating)